MDERRVPIPWTTAARIIAHGPRLQITAALQLSRRGAIAMPFNNGAWLSRQNDNVSNSFAIVGRVNGHGDPVAQALGSVQRNETSKLYTPPPD